MKILTAKKSKQIRRHYFNKFLNKNTDLFQHEISKPKLCSDGFCYCGYMWDTFLNPQLISYNQAIKKIMYSKFIYILWDINSCENIFIQNYWKYPKKRVLLIPTIEFKKISKTLPEDIYIFDETFEWTIALTHEDIDGTRYCLYQKAIS